MEDEHDGTEAGLAGETSCARGSRTRGQQQASVSRNSGDAEFSSRRRAAKPRREQPCRGETEKKKEEPKIKGANKQCIKNATGHRGFVRPPSVPLPPWAGSFYERRPPRRTIVGEEEEPRSVQDWKGRPLAKMIFSSKTGCLPRVACGRFSRTASSSSPSSHAGERWSYFFVFNAFAFFSSSLLLYAFCVLLWLESTARKQNDGGRWT